MRRLLARPARAQLITGPAGIGKTTLARAIAADLSRQGRTIVPIIGVAELRAVPAAALAPVLLSASRGRGERNATGAAGAAATADTADVAHEPIADTPDAVGERVHRFVAAVGSHAGEHALAVDDVSLLDDVTAGVVYQLVRVFGVPAILTDRSGRRLPGPILRLVNEGLLDQIELPPLATGELVEVVERFLGGHLHPDTTTRLEAASQGNPLVLRELILTAEARGCVVPGALGIEIDTVSHATRLVDSAREQLTVLTDSQRQLAEQLALSQPWPEDLAFRADEAALRGLVRHGIATVSTVRSRTLVRIAHPLLTEALIADIGPDRRVDLARRAAAALLSTGDDDDRRRAVHLLPEDEVEASELEWAATAAASAGDPAAALRLARAAERRRPTASSALVRAVALSALGRDADQAFLDAAERAEDDPRRALVALRHGQHLAYRCRDPRAAAELARGVRTGLDPSATALLDAEVAKWLAMVGESSGYEPADGVPPIARLGGFVTEAMFATMAGDVERATEAVTLGRPLAEAHRTELPHAESLLELSQFLVHVASADIRPARELAERERLDGDADAAGMWAYTLALVEFHAGRADRAHDLARLAVRQLQWRDFTGLVDVALSLEHTCAVVGGDETAIALVREQAPSSDIKVVLQRAEAEAWALVGDGRTDDALGVVCAAVEEGLRQRHHLLAALTATTAIRFGRARAVSTLLDRAADASGSPLCDLLARTARARSRGEYGECLDLVPALTRAGMVAVAARIARDAAVRAGAGATRTRARVAAAHLAARTLPDPPRTPDDDEALSPREWQIARAAAARHRSREIATDLGLSVRTVDNHLASVYRKLGVSGRDELAAALEGRGDSPPPSAPPPPPARRSPSPEVPHPHAATGDTVYETTIPSSDAVHP